MSRPAAGRWAGAGERLRRAARACRRAWAGLRTLTGDDAFERYLQHQVHSHPGVVPLGRREFYEESQRRKWSGVSRCC